MDKSIRIAGIVLALALLCTFTVSAASAVIQPSVSPDTGTSASGIVTVYFFYGEECPHCHDVMPFVEDMRKKYPDVEFRILETWHNETNNALSVSLNKQLGVTDYGVPEVVVGDTALIGSQEIPAKLESLILEQKKLTTPVPNLTVSSPASVQPPGKIDATYFYGDTCSHCAKVKPLLDDLETRYPDLNLTRLEVYNNAANRERLMELSRAAGVQNPGVPIIFMGKTVLVGDLEITDRFEPEILAERERIASCNTTPQANLTPLDPGCAPATPALSLPLVIFAAMVDSTNPCGLSVLVFLLISMAAAGDKKRILMVGGAYIAAMFLFHLLVGIGLFSVFSLSGLSKIFSLLGGAVALILGIITITDVLRNRETFLLSIPESRKGLLGKYIRIASLPAAFILGILAGILGFTCTGGIYISILGLMGRDMTVMTGLPWLILYNLVYILPLVLLTLLVAYGISPERADRIRTEYKRPIRLIIGGILIALGAVILLGWLG